MPSEMSQRHMASRAMITLFPRRPEMLARETVTLAHLEAVHSQEITVFRPRGKAKPGKMV